MNSLESICSSNIVVPGGGGGAPVIARGIAEACPDANITLILGTHDHGGSSGILRDELGIPAPGDVRNGLAAFSSEEKAAIIGTRFASDATLDTVRELGDELFQTVTATQPDLSAEWAAMQIDDADELSVELVEGGHTLHKHTYGNLLVAAMTRNTNIGIAAQQAGTLLGIPKNRAVLPTTTTPHELVMNDGGNIVVGEGAIDTYTIQNPDDVTISLTEKPEIYTKTKTAIENADVFVVPPGSFETSVAPIYLVQGVKEAMSGMKHGSKVVAVANLATSPHETRTRDLATYVEKLEEYTHDASTGEGRKIDSVIFNNQPDRLPVGVQPIAYDRDSLEHIAQARVVIGENLLDEHQVVKDPNDSVVRSEVHHNGRLVGTILLEQVISTEKIVPGNEYSQAA